MAYVGEHAKMRARLAGTTRQHEIYMMLAEMPLCKGKSSSRYLRLARHLKKLKKEA